MEWVIRRQTDKWLLYQQIRAEQVFDLLSLFVFHSFFTPGTGAPSPVPDPPFWRE